MILENITVRFKQMEVTAQRLDFSRTGVYRVTGPVGSGKSSIMEKILFQDTGAVFRSPEQQNQYARGDRLNLFAYVPQTIPDVKISAGEYILRGNASHEQTALAAGLLARLGADADTMGLRFSLLSGGEKQKVAVVYALMKGTPYIFLDEPTNSLDNGSVSCLCDMLEEFGRDKSVIVITHDPRLRPQGCTEITFEDGKATQHETPAGQSGDLNTLTTTKNRSGRLKRCLHIVSSALGLMTLAASLVVNIALMVDTDTRFGRDYAPQQPVSPNTVMAYSAEYVYGQLNKVYAEYEHLKIDPERESAMIQYADVPAIAAMPGVERVYVTDFEFLHELAEANWQGELSVSLRILSFPEFFMEFSESVSTPYRTEVLESGRFPKDNMSQAALSEKLLTLYFGFDEKTASDAVGRTQS